jgi:hypothetical protein
MTVNNLSCETCLRGKQSRQPVPKIRTTESKQVLELVHTDISGPFRVKSLGGARYFISFIDDFSRQTFVYFIHDKSEAFKKFRTFHQEMERHTKQKLRTLRSDNGGEFTSSEFNDYCALHGIKRQLSQPYTPQHNGVAERRNRSLLDITRCFLLERDLPGNLWAEAIRAACHILNLRSTLRSLGKTPFELFSGRKPNVSNLRIFGSTVYVYDTKPGKSKLDNRSRKCLYLSRDDRTKGFRCFDILTHRVLVSKDVRFLEDTTPVEISSAPPPDNFNPIGPYMEGGAMHDLPPSPPSDPPPAPEALTPATSSAPSSPIVPNVPSTPSSSPHHQPLGSSRRSASHIPTMRVDVRSSKPRAHDVPTTGC